MNKMFKRVFDFCFSIFALLLTGWVMCVTAIVIKCTSKGPVIYKAKRVGLDGQIFTLYKFRSMRVDSGEIKVTTLSTDERIYPFGKFIRKAKIDELPQLFNIFMGSMSVVGPRPEDVEVAREYYVGKYEAICSVKPGLTSPASLLDYTHGEMFESEEKYISEFLPVKLEMELCYVKKQSIFYDIFLIFRTMYIIASKVFGKKNFKYSKEYYEVIGNIKDKQTV